MFVTSYIKKIKKLDQTLFNGLITFSLSLRPFKLEIRMKKIENFYLIYIKINYL